MAKMVCFSLGIISVAVIASISLQSSSHNDIELIEVTPRVIEFGEVDMQQHIKTGFEIHNNSDVEYNVVDLTRSCSCFVDTIDWPIATSPGESVLVPIEYRTPRMAGDVKQRFLVSFERADSRRRLAFQKPVDISCLVLLGLRSTPSRLDFGSLASHDDPTLVSFTINPDSNVMYYIESIAVARPEIDRNHRTYRIWTS